MDRARLSILAVCALLTTTIDPFVGHSELPEVAAHDVDAATKRTAVPNPDTSTAGESAIDEEIASQILARLSMRHTALSVTERHELVRTIIREAREHDLEPGLVVAVIEVESAGYHLAVSHVGAMGLMQILPATGKELADRLGVDWKGPDTLFDPTINVKLGTAYLRQLADRYGSVQTALAAYNWGPGRIDRRLRRGATVPSRYIEQVMRAVDRNSMVAVTRS
jgi:soluble lytic murein transglycosylase-like protein